MFLAPILFSTGSSFRTEIVFGNFGEDRSHRDAKKALPHGRVLVTVVSTGPRRMYQS